MQNTEDLQPRMNLKIDQVEKYQNASSEIVAEEIVDDTTSKCSEEGHYSKPG